MTSRLSIGWNRFICICANRVRLYGHTSDNYNTINSDIRASGNKDFKLIGHSEQRLLFFSIFVMYNGCAIFSFAKPKASLGRPLADGRPLFHALHYLQTCHHVSPVEVFPATFQCFLVEDALKTVALS